MPRNAIERTGGSSWSIWNIGRTLVGIGMLIAAGIAVLRSSSGTQVATRGTLPPKVPQTPNHNECTLAEIASFTFEPGNLMLPVGDYPNGGLRYPMLDHIDGLTWTEAYDDEAHANYQKGFQWAIKQIGKGGDLSEGRMPFPNFLHELSQIILPTDRIPQRMKRYRNENRAVFIVEDNDVSLVGNSNVDRCEALNEKDNKLVRSIRTKIHHIAKEILKVKLKPHGDKEYDKILVDLMTKGNSVEAFPLVSMIPSAHGSLEPFVVYGSAGIPKKYQLTAKEKAYISAKIDIKEKIGSLKLRGEEWQKEFVKIANQLKEDKDVVKMVGHIHMLIVKPFLFSKGNGRLARLTMNLLGIAHGLPPIIFHNRKEYLHAVHAASRQNDPNMFVTYVRNIVLGNNMKVASNMCTLLKKKNDTNCHEIHNFHSCLSFIRVGYDHKRAEAEHKEHKKAYRQKKGARLRQVRRK